MNSFLNLITTGLSLLPTLKLQAKVDVKDALKCLGQQDLVMNVFKNGKLGSYRHSFLDSSKCTSIHGKQYFPNFWKK